MAHGGGRTSRQGEYVALGPRVSRTGGGGRYHAARPRPPRASVVRSWTGPPSSQRRTRRGSNSHSPYSRFPVGAALLAEDGTVWVRHQRREPQLRPRALRRARRGRGGGRRRPAPLPRGPGGRRRRAPGAPLRRSAGRPSPSSAAPTWRSAWSTWPATAATSAWASSSPSPSSSRRADSSARLGEPARERRRRRGARPARELGPVGGAGEAPLDPDEAGSPPRAAVAASIAGVADQARAPSTGQAEAARQIDARPAGSGLRSASVSPPTTAANRRAPAEGVEDRAGSAAPACW